MSEKPRGKQAVQARLFPTESPLRLDPEHLEQVVAALADLLLEAAEAETEEGSDGKAHG